MGKDQGREPASPFEGWIDAAAVRAKPPLTDFRLGGGAGELAGVQWFVFGAHDPLMAHPTLKPLDLAARNRLGAARLVHFLDDMVLTEHRIVNTAAQCIAEGRLSAYVPEGLANDALKLYTDEGYHAWFTAEASRAIRTAFQLPARDGPSAKIDAIEALVASVTPERRDVAWFLVGFVGETLVTQAIVEAMRGSAHSAIQNLLLAHLEDEWVHAKYFSLLFGRVWPRLTADEQVFFGALLPGLMAAFHTVDVPFHQGVLAQAGLNDTARDRVVAQVFDAAWRTARIRHMGGHTLQVLERNGVFRHTAARDAFVSAGLLDLDSRR